jgi:hypothetical protein
MRAWGDAPRDPRLPEWRCDEWPDWRDIRDHVLPKREIHRLDPYLVHDAINWATSTRGICWYSDVEFGQWCAELSGLPMFGGGDEAADKLRRETGNRSIFVSLKSRGRGFNGLQFVFSEQLLAQMPSSGTAHEQLYGRLHRRGQAAATVKTLCYLHTDELIEAFEQAMRRGEHTEGTLGANQKLVEAWRE